MSDKSLAARTDEGGHITPAQDDAQRSADIDAQVAAAREGRTDIGANDYAPGEWGPDSVATNTEIRPKDDGQTDEEARVRSEAIDAQVEAARTGGVVGMQTGVATAGPTHEPMPGHNAAGRDLRKDPQAEAVAASHAEDANLEDLTIGDLRALARARSVELGGATKKEDIVKALEKAAADAKKSK